MNMLRRIAVACALPLFLFALPASAQVVCANPASLNIQPCSPMPMIAGVYSSALESGHVLKATPGYLEHLSIATGATSGWVTLLDAAAIPSNGAITPKWCMAVPSNGTVGGGSWSWVQSPLTFTTGIVVLFSSTTCLNFTGSATAFFSAGVL